MQYYPDVQLLSAQLKCHDLFYLNIFHKAYKIVPEGT